MFIELLSFAIALIASIGFTPVARKLALRLGVIDHPGPRKIHLSPMPLMGGLAMYVAAVMTIIIFTYIIVADYSTRAQIIGILAGSTLLVVVGIMDDRGILHHQVKFLIAMPVAAIILLASGIRVQFMTVFFASPLSTLLDVFLTLFWVVGITAAFSILDHMDGLCTGVTAMASFFFLACAVSNGQDLIGTLAAAMMGSSLGFLCWNFNPAKIFMGDGGAMFLGFMMATLGLKLRFPTLNPAISWMIPVVILGVVILDTTLVTISRARRGLIPFASPGKDHIAHRLVKLGLSQRRAVLVLYGLSILSGLLALLITQLSLWQTYTLVSIIILGALLIIIVLEHVPYERQGVQNVSDIPDSFVE
jgi:UDP-GlcNAc:undecaprenyl-phosphate GlcNAc-1-phosphate transferase